MLRKTFLLKKPFLFQILPGSQTSDHLFLLGFHCYVLIVVDFFSSMWAILHGQDVSVTDPA